MSSATVQSSGQIPYASGIIERPRLLERLAAAVEHKLTLVTAPPGYGKTTLVAQFAVHAPYPVAWHTVEESERDVPNLYRECLASLSPLMPGVEALKSLPGQTPAELAAVIASQVREKIYGDLIYVLDDLQHLAGSSAAESWLRSLVTLLPASCHLILISRVIPDIPLTEMIARREVLAIGQEQLRFTPEEVYSLARQTQAPSAPSIVEAQELTSRLEGWPAGTILALHPLPADLERAMLKGGHGPEALFDALADSMLHSQPPGLRDFLLTSSTLHRLTPELCTSVLRLPDSARWLAEAQSRHLFLTRVSGGLVYHRLFRSFLQRKLQEDNPTAFVSLHARAARWFEENNRIDESFDHYLAAGLTERAATLAERVAQAYFAQGRVETLLSWGEQLREKQVRASRLFYICAIIHSDRYDYEAAEVELHDAEKGFEQRNDEVGIANVQLHRAVINLQRGEYTSAASQAAQLVQLPLDSANIHGRALKVLGVARLHLGELEAATQHLEAALPLHRTEGDAYTLANVLQDLGVAYARLGRFDDTSACLQEVVALRRSLGSAGALALALNNLGYHYHRTSDYRRAMATFQEGLAIVARVPNRRAESYLLWSIADLMRDRGAFDEALQAYNRALELTGNSEPALRCAILINASTLRRWQGVLHEAMALAEEAAVLAEVHNIALESSMAQVALWASHAQLGEIREALRYLESFAGVLREQNVVVELVQVFGLCANAALLCGDTFLGEQHLKAALDTARQVGSNQRLAAEIIHTPLLESFISKNAARYKDLIKDVNLLGDAQLKPASGIPVNTPRMVSHTYSLRVLTLGHESMERDGVPIPASEWRATAARELFLYLLFIGPESREQISLDFWPDSSPKRVRSNFHTTLYRARHALGENVIVFQDGLYQINPDLDLWCDIHELEVLSRQARLLSPRDARTEDLWRKAVELYRGDFLPSLDTDWVFARREALREVYIEALVGLGECARARNDFREAVSLFRRALAIDHYREDIHRAIMTCYAERGEKRKVLTHLKELRQLLQQELAVEPSPETLALANALLR